MKLCFKWNLIHRAWMVRSRSAGTSLSVSLLSVPPVALYAISAVYFAGVMVRLMLTLTPVVCMLSAVAFSSVFEHYLGDDMKRQSPPVEDSSDEDDRKNAGNLYDKVSDHCKVCGMSCLIQLGWPKCTKALLYDICVPFPKQKSDVRNSYLTYLKLHLSFFSYESEDNVYCERWQTHRKWSPSAAVELSFIKSFRICQLLVWVWLPTASLLWLHPPATSAGSLFQSRSEQSFDIPTVHCLPHKQP